MLATPLPAELLLLSGGGGWGAVAVQGSGVIGAVVAAGAEPGGEPGWPGEQRDGVAQDQVAGAGAAWPGCVVVVRWAGACGRLAEQDGSEAV
jgi:hypothetical protein